MRRIAKGFGLVEIMVAMVLGLIVTLGIIQIFTASRVTYSAQNSSARMQEDARFVLSKLIQEIRMTGMYGCLSPDSVAPVSPGILAPAAFSTPILWDNSTNTLTLITADVGSAGGTPTWTIISDCQNANQIYTGAKKPSAGQTAFPLRQLTYVLKGTELSMQLGAANAQPLLSNVAAFTVTFGVAGTPMSYTNAITAANADTIRSVRLTLTLQDPENRVRNQTYNVVAALRNRF